MDVTYHNPKIYFISGKAQAGKTTTGSIIKDIYAQRSKKTVELAIAKYLKDYAISFFGWDGREETKPRELLQQLGTDIIREKLNMPMFFVDRLIDDIKVLSYFFDVIVVSDARFKVEIDKSRGAFKKLIAIKVIRDNYDNGLTDKQKQHPTEIDLDDYDKIDYYIHNDGTIDSLREKITAIIDKEEAQDEKNE